MALLNMDNPFTKLKFRYLILRFILLTILLGLILGILQASGSFKLKQNDLVLVLYIIQFVLLCLWLRHDFQRLGIKLKYIVGDFPKNHNWLRLAGLVLLAIIFSASAYLVLFNLLALAAPSFVEQALRDVAKSPSANISKSFESNVLVTFAFCVIAPITEEFIFRGVILQRFCTKWGIRTGLLSSSLLFGFLHPNPIGLSLLGIILGVSYIKTRSLIVPIAFHAFNNIFAVSMQLLSPKSATYTPTEQLQSLRSSWWVGIVLMAISLPFILRFLRRNWPHKDTVIPYLSNANKENWLNL